MASEDSITERVSGESAVSDWLLQRTLSCGGAEGANPADASGMESV
jgi:hypothetical protein